jgi:hypothetical protein
MSRTPTETVAFLKTKLQPLTLDEARLSELLEALGSDDKAVWEPAFDTFEYFDPRLAMDLEVLMDLVVDTPTRQRLVEVLCSRPKGHLEGKDITLSKTGKDSFNFRADNGSWWAEHKIERLGTGWNRKPPWSRATRAIVLLESIGTPEAIAILRDMATGHPDTAPTKVAQEALKKLADTPPAE